MRPGGGPGPRNGGQRTEGEAMKRCLECGKVRCPDVTFYKAASEQEKAFMQSGMSPDDIRYVREQRAKQA